MEQEFDLLCSSVEFLRNLKTPGLIACCQGKIFNKSMLVKQLNAMLDVFFQPDRALVSLLRRFFHQFGDNKIVVAMFRGIRPAVVALIAVPTFNLAKSAQITLTNCWIPILSALLIWKIGVNPIYIIIAAGIGGYLYGRYIKPTE